MCNWKYFLFVIVRSILYTTFVKFSLWITFLESAIEYQDFHHLEWRSQLEFFLSYIFCSYLVNLLCSFENFLNDENQTSLCTLLNLKIFVRALLALSCIFSRVNYICFQQPFEFSRMVLVFFFYSFFFCKEKPSAGNAFQPLILVEKLQHCTFSSNQIVFWKYYFGHTTW